MRGFHIPNAVSTQLARTHTALTTGAPRVVGRRWVPTRRKRVEAICTCGVPDHFDGRQLGVMGVGRDLKETAREKIFVVLVVCLDGVLG